VQADAQLDVGFPGPVCDGVGTLHLDRRADSVASAGEGEEERVALPVDLDSACRAEGSADDVPVLREHLPVPVAEPADEVGRRLDVREREGDGAAGQRSSVAVRAGPSGGQGSVGSSSASSQVDVHVDTTGRKQPTCRPRTAGTRRV
jgi:hypothetical protein